MYKLLLAFTLMGCGASVKGLPISDVVKPTRPQYCVVATVKYKSKIVPIYSCTPSKSMCEQGVKDLKGTAGEIVGVKSITGCKLVQY
jgi:hypothetical protein